MPQFQTWEILFGGKTYLPNKIRQQGFRERSRAAALFKNLLKFGIAGIDKGPLTIFS